MIQDFATIGTWKCSSEKSGWIRWNFQQNKVVRNWWKPVSLSLRLPPPFSNMMLINIYAANCANYTLDQNKIEGTQNISLRIIRAKIQHCDIILKQCFAIDDRGFSMTPYRWPSHKPIPSKLSIYQIRHHAIMFWLVTQRATQKTKNYKR